MITVEKLEVRSGPVRQSVFLDANSGSSAHLLACLCRSALPFHLRALVSSCLFCGPSVLAKVLEGQGEN